MKPIQKLISAYSLMAGLAVLSVGCEPKEPTVDSQLKDAKEEVKNAAEEVSEATQTFAANSKDEVVAAGQAALDKMNEQIDTLSAKAASLSGDAKTKLDEGVAELKKLRDATSDELDKVKEAGEDTWQEVKGGLDTAWNNLQDAYKEVEAQLTE